MRENMSDEIKSSTSNDEIWDAAESAISTFSCAVYAAPPGACRVDALGGYFNECQRTVNVYSMQNPQSRSFQRVLAFLVGLLIFKVTVGVVLKYHDYFPPNFESDFLSGRERYFSGVYQWAFYAHIVSGPFSLILGMILVSERFRLWFPRWHRYLGMIQVINVLCVVTPSGFWMSYYAETGLIAATGFAMLAIATGTCVAFGWRSAVKRQFSKHRRWMWRCFLCLSSAVVLRLIAGLTIVADIDGDWIYPMSAWVSWLAPLMAFEFVESVNRRIEKNERRPLAENNA